MKSAKEKGKLLENWVADLIVSKGIDTRARRDGASGAGNREKGDINTSMMILGQNAGIEVKNQKTLSIPNWWKQTKKLEKLNREPVLVFKIQGEGFGDTLSLIYLDTLLELIKASYTEKKIIIEDKDDSRDKKYAIQQMLSALKKLEKHYD